MPSPRRLLPVLALLLLTAGCSWARTQQLRRGSLARVPTEVVRGVESHLEDVRPALVRITTWMGIKTGVVVRADGLILTCAHGSWLPGSLEEIRFADGRTGRARVMGEAEESDLLTLQIVEPDGPFATVPLAAGVEPGDWAFVASLVRGGTSVGLAAGEVRMVDVAGAFGPDNDYRNPVLIIDAPAVHGESGAPVLDREGRIIGIASMAGITKDAVALVAGSIHEIHKVLPSISRGESIMSRTDTVQRIEAFLESLRRNPLAIWPKEGRPDPAFLAAHERCWSEVSRTLRRRWAGAEKMTAEMTAEGLRELADAVAGEKGRGPIPK